MLTDDPTAELVRFAAALRQATITPVDRNLAEARSYATVRLPGHNFEALRELARVIGR